MPTKNSEYREQMTNAIIEMLDKGTAPWTKPWEPNSSMSLPTNPTTGKPYRGGNSLWLTWQQMKSGWDDPRWMTYKQAEAKGWQIRRGEKGTHIEYWKFTDEKIKKDDKGNIVRDASGEPVKIHVRLENPRSFMAVVFNAKQIDGVPELERKAKVYEWNPLDKAEEILRNSGAQIFHDQGDRAFYSPSRDEIHLPQKDQFPSQERYYGTALHELGHWTGHESRLSRKFGMFGDEAYAREELRAELASYFLANELGVSHDPNQHAAYVQSWIKVLKQDKNEIFRASRDAEEITEFVMGCSNERTKDLAQAKGEATLEEIREQQMKAAHLQLTSEYVKYTNALALRNDSGETTYIPADFFPGRVPASSKGLPKEEFDKIAESLLPQYHKGNLVSWNSLEAVYMVPPNDQPPYDPDRKGWSVFEFPRHAELFAKQREVNDNAIRDPEQAKALIERIAWLRGESLTEQVDACRKFMPLLYPEPQDPAGKIIYRKAYCADKSSAIADQARDYLDTIQRQDLGILLAENHSIEHNRVSEQVERDSYMAAAKWVAEHGYDGSPGTPLPANMTATTVEAINADIPQFKRYVAEFAEQQQQKSDAPKNKAENLLQPADHLAQLRTNRRDEAEKELAQTAMFGVYNCPASDPSQAERSALAQFVIRGGDQQEFIHSIKNHDELRELLAERDRDPVATNRDHAESYSVIQKQIEQSVTDPTWQAHTGNQAISFRDMEQAEIFMNSVYGAERGKALLEDISRHLEPGHMTSKEIQGVFQLTLAKSTQNCTLSAEIVPLPGREKQLAEKLRVAAEQCHTRANAIERTDPNIPQVRQQNRAAKSADLGR